MNPEPKGGVGVEAGGGSAAAEGNDWIPYVAPMATFLILTSLEGYLPLAEGEVVSRWYPLAYAGKVAAVAAVAWACRSTWRDLRPRPNPRAIGLAVLLGVLVIVAWIGLDGLYPALPFVGATRQGFDPSGLSPPGRLAFLAVRFFGLVLLVPLVEELFWRSFLLRWVIDPNFLRVPIGRVTPLSAAVTSGAFALAHPEWLPALLTGLAWAWLLHRTRSLSACLISHAVANLALGVYVFMTGEWKFL